MRFLVKIASYLVNQSLKFSAMKYVKKNNCAFPKCVFEKKYRFICDVFLEKSFNSMMYVKLLSF